MNIDETMEFQRINEAIQRQNAPRTLAEQRQARERFYEQRRKVNALRSGHGSRERMRRLLQMAGNL